MKNYIIAGSLVAATFLASCSNKTEQKEKAPIRVKTELVAPAAIAGNRTYVGVVEETAATAVSFTGMGTVRRVAVSEGQAVGRGQLIAEMDDTQARNMLAAAEAQNRQAEDALARYSQLHEQGSMTDAQWVEIQSKVEQARSQLAIARKNLADCRLVAPVSGVIGRKNISAGETAMPSQAVVTIVDISSVKVKFSVPEAEVAAIVPTTPTLIAVDAIGCECAGGTIEKSVQADPLTHTYDCRVRVNNKDRKLLPGMVASVTVQGVSTGDVANGQNCTGALTLPLNAVQRRADGSLFVWTVGQDNTAHRTALTIGEGEGNSVSISSGLSEGMRVVVEGYQKLSEGTKVVY
ncbi:MAG: efflux RND transporter periplasmic adaptor subunit [Bacteroidaceae bacterium]|nr:efflux RND transporter periplasmic adaptor subunit [Bacteroidaceae bacterium]